MSHKNDIFELSEEQKLAIRNLLDKSKKEVPAFYEEGISESVYVPVEGGEIRVFHYKPEKPITKKPFIYVPGFFCPHQIWKDIHIANHNTAEYYYIESREKSSSKIKRGRKANFTIDQLARDLQKVIEFFEIDKTKYNILGASYGAAMILQGLIKNYFTPDLSVLYDPLARWDYAKFLTYVINPITPPFVLGFIRMILAHVFLPDPKNVTQREKILLYIKEAEPWKFRKSSIHIRDFNIVNDLPKITDNVIVCHGPSDNLHKSEEYFQYAKAIPKCKLLVTTVSDEEREHFYGIMANIFSQYEEIDSIPPPFKIFEIPLD
jgi:hypothetical protein